MPMRLAVSALSSLLLLVSLTGRGAAQTHTDTSRSTMSGVYSPAQAARGEETYMNVCVACHPKGTYSTPIFRTTWNGRLVSELFEVVKDKMPKNDPGTLTSAEVAQVLSYLLKVNDVPSGETELPEDLDALKKIRFETPGHREGKAER